MVARRQDDVLEYPGRYDENELTVAVVHALASVTSTTSCGILVVAGLVCISFIENASTISHSCLPLYSNG